MYGTAPCFVASSRFSRERYALSAHSAAGTNPLANVRSSIGANNGQSLAFGPSTMAVVMTFVVVPVMTCALTHARPLRSWPYFSSNQRTNRDVLNPVLSGANVVSMARIGHALRSINWCRYGVIESE